MQQPIHSAEVVYQWYIQLLQMPGEIFTIIQYVMCWLSCCTCSCAASLLMGTPTGNSDAVGVKDWEPLERGLRSTEAADLTTGLQ